MNFILIYNVFILVLIILFLFILIKISTPMFILFLVFFVYMYYLSFEHLLKRNFIYKINKQLHRISNIENIKYEDLKILDFGSGKNCLTAKKFPNLDITSIDIVDSNDPKYIKYDGNVKKLPFKDKQFDIVISCFVLHHIEEQEDIIKELKRISKYIILYEDDITTAPNKFLFTEISKAHYNFFDQDIELVKYIHTPNKWISMFNCDVLFKENIKGVFMYGFVPHICLIFKVDK